MTILIKVLFLVLAFLAGALVTGNNYSIYLFLKGKYKPTLDKIDESIKALESKLEELLKNK